MSDELNQVRSALLKVADRLSALQTAKSPTNTSQASQLPPQVSQASTSFSNNNSSSNLSTTAGNTVATEQRRLFGYSNNRVSRKGKCPKPKREATCTLKLVCLSSNLADGPPTTVKERTYLSNIGLGDAAVTFNANEYVYEKIIDTFPLLKNGGGYEMCLFQRGGGEDGGFHVIHTPHTANRLKQLAGQAKIYVRPVQKDIDPGPEEITSVSMPEVPLDQPKTVPEIHVPKVDCFVCGEPVSMDEIAQHQQTHHPDPAPLPAAKKQKTLDSILVETESRASTSEDSESTSNLKDHEQVKEICPDATDEEIQEALNASNGDGNNAVARLLGLQSLPDLAFEDPCDLVAENENGLAPVLLDGNDCSDAEIDKCLPETSLQLFQSNIIDDASLKQRISVCRMDGVMELRKEIMGVYKNPKTNLKTPPKVRFEEEEGVGSGPLREFFVETMKVIDEGIPSGTGKPLLFLEGEADHRIPTHDHGLRITGAYRAMGRMIGHSILHGGTGLHGLSPAIKNYLSTDVDSENPPLLTVDDIPDIELRELITELDELPVGDKPNQHLRGCLEPYIMEAGLDPDQLSSHRKLIVDGLMTFHVIDKRRLALDDIIKGMEEVKLYSHLKKYPNLVHYVFPAEAERVLSGKEIKDSFYFEEELNAKQQKTVEFFKTYIDEIEGVGGGSKLKKLLLFWTGESNFRASTNQLLVKLDPNLNDLPMSETCFRSINLPTKHEVYSEFKRFLDIAVDYGSSGFAFH